MDASRTAPVHRVGSPRVLPPEEEWLDYALAARVMMIRATPDRFVAVDGPLGAGLLTFAAWMEGGHELGWPTLDDFEYHLTTLFPPVRPRGWLELRMLDSLPDPWWRVAAAVATALLEDADAGAAALEAVNAPPAGAGVTDHWRSAARHGLADPALRTAAQRCFRPRSTGSGGSAPTGPRWPRPRLSTTGSWPGAGVPPTSRRRSPRWNWRRSQLRRSSATGGVAEERRSARGERGARAGA